MLICASIGLLFNLVMGKILHSKIGGHHDHGHSHRHSQSNPHNHGHNHK